MCVRASVVDKPFMFFPYPNSYAYMRSHPMKIDNNVVHHRAPEDPGHGGSRQNHKYKYKYSHKEL